METVAIVVATLVRKPVESVWEKWRHEENMEKWRSQRHYQKVIPFQLIGYVFDDGRKGWVEFQHIDQNTIIRESFEPDPAVPLENQRACCQSRLEEFRKLLEES